MSRRGRHFTCDAHGHGNGHGHAHHGHGHTHWHAERPGARFLKLDREMRRTRKWPARRAYEIGRADHWDWPCECLKDAQTRAAVGRGRPVRKRHGDLFLLQLFGLGRQRCEIFGSTCRIRNGRLLLLVHRLQLKMVRCKTGRSAQRFQCA